MPSPRILCFGELLLRLAAPGRELLLQSGRLDVCLGGAEANVAITLAGFGHAVSMLGAVPDNALGAHARGELRRYGIDTSHVSRRPGRMGLYFLETGAALRPSQVLYDRAGSAFANTAAADYDWPSLLAGHTALHLSGVTPALGAEPAAAAIAAARTARDLGLRVSFDGNFRGKLWQAWDGNPQEILHEIFAEADTIFADHRDIGLVLGRDFTGEAPEHIAAIAADLAFGAFPHLQRIVATRRIQHHVDDHELSARMFTREGALQTAACRITPIVDRIGTGDAFAAGVLHGIFSSQHDQSSLDFGLAAACLKHTIPGDFMHVGVDAVRDLIDASGFDVRR